VFFPGQKHSAELKCETIHILKTNDGLYRTGLSFINPTLSFQITLLKTAYTQTKISELP